MTDNRTQAEQAFICCAILDPDILVSTILTEAMFTQYRRFFAKLIEASATVRVDYSNTLPLLKAGIEASDIAEVMESVPSSANWEYYQKLVFEAWATDGMRQAARIVGTQNYPECIETIDKAMTAVMIRQTGAKTARVGDLVGKALERIVERAKARGALPGISFGFPGIDAATMGAQPSQLIVIGARPSQGKSALMGQVSRSMANAGVKNGIVTVESSELELVGRMVSAEARVDGRKLNTGMLNAIEMASIRDNAARMLEWRDMILIHDQPSIQLSQLQNVIRRMVREGARCVFLDYLQLVRVLGKKNRIEEVGEVSTALKALARETRVPIIALAQLNRDADNQRPHMGNFQHSSQIEQDADQCWLLWHKTDSDGKVTESRIIVAKARDGHVVDVPVRFDRPILTFFEIEREQS